MRLIINKAASFESYYPNQDANQRPEQGKAKFNF